MSAFRYAQIDGANVCIAVSTFATEIDAPNMILLGPDENPIGHVWDDGVWTAPDPRPEPIPDAVTARQFKLQLLASSLLDSVEAWIDTQDRAVQIAYDNSGMFVRSEPMMEAGFSALGFTPEQIDAFFTAASKL